MFPMVYWHTVQQIPPPRCGMTDKKGTKLDINAHSDLEAVG
jgi:hypothetical protein